MQYQKNTQIPLDTILSFFVIQKKKRLQRSVSTTKTNSPSQPKLPKNL